MRETTQRRRFLIVPAGLLVILSLSIALVAKTFVRPAAQPAKSYPAHDDHPTEKVAMAADPYDTPEKANIFSVNFREHGLLPVFFIVTNDGDQPVSIVNLDIKLVTGNRSKLTPVSPDDIFRRLANPQANTNSPIPFPIPRKKVKGTISSKEMDEINSAQFAAKAVEPHNTQSGFFFFDVAGIAAPLGGAHMYISGAADSQGTELMYFDVPMDKYPAAPRN